MIELDGQGFLQPDLKDTALMHSVKKSVGNLSSWALHTAKNSAYITGIRRLGWYEVNGIYNCWVTYLPFHQGEIGKRIWQIIFLFDHSQSSCCVSSRCPFVALYILCYSVLRPTYFYHLASLHRTVFLYIFLLVCLSLYSLFLNYKPSHHNILFIFVLFNSTIEIFLYLEIC